MLTGNKQCKITGRRLAWILPLVCWFLWIGPGPLATAASLTATLDRETVITGESATLTLTFEGGDPDAFPTPNAGPNVRVVNRGSSRSISYVNGQVNSKVIQTFALIPLQPGVYQIPALHATIQGHRVESPPLKFTALKPNETASGQAEQQLAYMRLFIPQKEVFVGQPLAVEFQVFVRDGVANAEEILRAFDSYNAAPITAEGCRVLRTARANRRRAQSGAAGYTVSTLVTAITPLKVGQLNIESIKVPLTLQLLVPGQRRRDIFDPFGMFQQTEGREVILSAPPETLSVLPLPSEEVPLRFNGAVGLFSMTTEAGPTNVAVGDPITVRVRIEGRGDLEGLVFPDQGWSEFKTYPPTSEVHKSDPLGLEGLKIFEQVVVPQSEEIRSLPPINFSFFDPEKRTYRTLTSAPLPLSVRSGGTIPSPTATLSRTEPQENLPPEQDIVSIKRKLGSAPAPGTPLVQQPWFLALQMVPILSLIGSIVWRKRQDAWTANPRLRRRQEVERKVRSGISDLHRFATENDSDAFFLTLFRLLQEQIGERLDAPASSITEAVVEERLRPKGVSDEVLAGIKDLFQQCDQARYAPVSSSHQLAALIPQVKGVLGKIRESKL